MEQIIEALLLGIIQGLTEFLPVSSSGHLEIAKYLFDDARVGEQSLLMTVVLHFATAVATVFVFRSDLRAIFSDLLSFRNNPGTRFSAFIALSMVPAVIVGLFFEDAVEALFDKNMLLVGVALVVTGMLLFLADRAGKTDKPVGWRSALLIGLAQAVAIIPGISRSGATISTSVLLGIDRDRAARFSFLMVVPLIFGKMAKDLLDGKVLFTMDALLPLTAGFAAAFVAGLFACWWMIRLVRQSRLTIFAVYCFGLAAILLANVYFGS